MVTGFALCMANFAIVMFTYFSSLPDHNLICFLFSFFSPYPFPSLYFHCPHFTPDVFGFRNVFLVSFCLLPNSSSLLILSIWLNSLLLLVSSLLPHSSFLCLIWFDSSVILLYVLSIFISSLYSFTLPSSILYLVWHSCMSCLFPAPSTLIFILHHPLLPCSPTLMSWSLFLAPSCSLFDSPDVLSLPCSIYPHVLITFPCSVFWFDSPVHRLITVAHPSLHDCLVSCINVSGESVVSKSSKFFRLHSL